MPTVWEHPCQTATSISMELVSLWDRDRVLYSMASHGCFQQTVHHYSVWQESKHCAFTWVKNTPPHTYTHTHTPLFAKSPHCVLMSPCFSSFSCFPVHVRHSLRSFLFCHQQRRRVDPYLTQTFSSTTSYMDFSNTINYLLPQPQGGTFSNKSIFIGSLSGTRTSNFICICYFRLSFSAISRLAEIVVKGQIWALRPSGCLSCA